MEIKIDSLKVKHISFRAGGLVLLLLTGIGIWILSNTMQARHQVDLLENMLQAEKYQEARGVFEGLKKYGGTYSEQAANHITEALAGQMEAVFSQALKGDPVSPAKIQGLKQFPEQFSPLLDAELTKVTNLYWDQKITYSMLAEELGVLQSITGKTTELAKYQYLARAEMLRRQYAYDEAEQVLDEALQTYPGDPLLTSRLTQCWKEAGQLVPYDGPIPHLFFHPLIVYPELAFDEDNLAQGYEDYFITVHEFNRILDALYKNNYLLIGLDTVFAKSEEKGKPVLVKKKLYLPPGKKPLIISIDDLNYYEYMLKNGNAHKLILDGKGNIAVLSFTPQGEKVISRDLEIIPILDQFVEKHPDFSWQGEKGIIALTGYQGVLGYRTQDGSPSAEQEKKEVLPVIRHLKETGWSFASHGYGHLDAAKVSYKIFVRDTLRWKEEVESLTGATNIYIYPFGSKVLPGDAKFRYLLDSGFQVLCSVGPTEYLKSTPAYAMMDRRHIDGLAFYYQRDRLRNFFDTESVTDPMRPVQK
ncbi:tetratricopeptide repeat protein [Candidatus Formimonas warabiya]|uniref:NodB homology domain-containing protein n=1 Tax=Formimonas warabiya TaxID=1761012 RepID=A0A3G1KUV1_FORW1|nr:tetratricopeptide repeat protein [Candidatus Formimonas warabiya]ATW26222.1 hypothetical protein DCMF_16930 [Candidatus Formimonas warabiya]